MISTFKQDLRLLSRPELTNKYGEHDWDGYYQGLCTDPLEPLPADLPIPQEIMLPTDTEEPEIAAPPYKGRAFGKFVMIRRLEHEHSGRLVMPSRIAGTSDVGWVASVGEETKHIKSGMIVVFDQYAGVGRECRLIDENSLPGNFLLVEEADVLAILEKV